MHPRHAPPYDAQQPCQPTSIAHAYVKTNTVRSMPTSTADQRNSAVTTDLTLPATCSPSCRAMRMLRKKERSTPVARRVLRGRADCPEGVGPRHQYAHAHEHVHSRARHTRHTVQRHNMLACLRFCIHSEGPMQITKSLGQGRPHATARAARLLQKVTKPFFLRQRHHLRLVVQACFRVISRRSMRVACTHTKTLCIWQLVLMALSRYQHDGGRRPCQAVCHEGLAPACARFVACVTAGSTGFRSQKADCSRTAPRCDLRCRVGTAGQGSSIPERGLQGRGCTVVVAPAQGRSCS